MCHAKCLGGPVIVVAACNGALTLLQLEETIFLRPHCGHFANIESTTFASYGWLQAWLWCVPLSLKKACIKLVQEGITAEHHWRASKWRIVTSWTSNTKSWFD